MTNTNKIRVAVLHGGRSTEHEVSLSSAANIIAHLDPTRFEVIPIKIDKQGTWFLQNQATLEQKIFAPEWLNEPEAARKTQLLPAQSFASADRLFDVIFPVMHGTFSEDGTIQGLLELANVPYVGCGVLASAVGMDKDVARRLVAQAGLPVVPYLAVKRAHWLKDAAAIEAQLSEMFTFPLFVKPVNQGSSIGVSKVKKKEDLAKAIEHAFCYDTKILVEQAIPAMELEVGLLESLDEGAEPFASLVGEARPNDEFYSYAAKYKEGGVEMLIPAPIPEALQQETQSLSKQIFEILNAEGMARIDFFMDKNTQALYFNELNSIPGFTPTSMYPEIIKASGLSFSDLLTQLIMLAMKRYDQKQALERSYIA